MNTPEKLLLEGAALTAGVHFLQEGGRRPTRRGGYEGGIIPDPETYGTADSVTMWAGSMALRYVFLHVIVIPFLVVWAAIMAGPPLAWSPPGSSLTWYDGVWLGVSGLIGLRILRSIFRVVNGRRPKRRQAATPVVARVRVVPRPEAGWEERPSGLVVRHDVPRLPPAPPLP